MSDLVAKQWIRKSTELLKKYRYVLLVLLIGLLLMTMPDLGLDRIESRNESTVSDPSPVESLEQKLSILLSKVEGAGDVEVILTVAEGKETIYQTNDDHSGTETSSSEKTSTVTVTDSNRNQNGLVRQVINETYKGAIIVCKGADDPSVRLSLVDAVARITGLGANCICVLKMK